MACARVFALVGGLCVFALVGWMSSLAGIPETLLSSLLKGALVGWIPSLAGVPETLLSSLLKGCVNGLLVDTSLLLYLTPSLLRSFAPPCFAPPCFARRRMK